MNTVSVNGSNPQLDISIAPKLLVWECPDYYAGNRRSFVFVHVIEPNEFLHLCFGCYIKMKATMPIKMNQSNIRILKAVLKGKELK